MSLPGSVPCAPWKGFPFPFRTAGRFPAACRPRPFTRW